MRVICCVLMLLFLGVVASASDIVLVNKGKPNACIVVGTAPSSAAQKAADELQGFIKRITGVQLLLVSDTNSGSGIRIYVGQSAAMKAASEMGIKIPSGLTYQFDDEGYVIAADNKQLILAGNETEPYMGTYYAVYDFLHSLGCRWYMPGEFGEVLPKLDTIKAAQGIRVVRPDMRVRDVWYSGHLVQTPQQQTDFTDWRRRNRLVRSGFWMHCMLPEAIYLQNPVDDSTKRLLPKDKYFTTHPEYYALNADGTRSPDFLCVSNPDAIQAAADTVMQYFRDNPNAFSFAFSPPDAPVLCNCENCKRAMHDGFGGEGFGDVSDPYFGMVFKIADMVRKVYPERWIISMAYYNRCRPPEGVDGKHPNVLIQYAFIQQCSIHSYDDQDCWTRSQFGAMLARWGELTNGLVAYDYDPHDWNHSQRPAWRSKGLAEDMRYAYRLGGWGYSDEGMMAWMVTGLNYYVRARLAWNLGEDAVTLEDDFFQKFFGPASKPMKSFYTGIENSLENSKSHYMNPFSGEGPKADGFINAVTPKTIRQSSAYLIQAQKIAVQEPYKSRVAAFKNYFGRIESLLNAREAMARGEWTKATEYAQGMLDAVSNVNNTMLLQDAGPWGGDQSGASTLENTRRIAAYADGRKGTLVSVIGPSGKYRTDPNSDGVTHRWYLPEAGNNWQDISLTAAWNHQGVVVPTQIPYRGILWYRVSVKITGSVPQQARIYVPEFRGDEIWVWVNGKFADNARVSSNTSLDISNLLKAGENIISFRVSGYGGFTIPPFIYRPVQ